MPVFDTFTIQAPNTSDTTRAFALRQEALNNLMKPLNGFADLAKNFTMAQQSQEAAEAQALIRAAMARGKNVEEMRQLGAQVSQQIDPRIWANAQGDKLVNKEIDRYITDSTDRRNWSANNRSWFDSMDRARLNDYIAQEVAARTYRTLGTDFREQRVSDQKQYEFDQKRASDEILAAVNKVIALGLPRTPEEVYKQLSPETLARGGLSAFNYIRTALEGAGIKQPFAPATISPETAAQINNPDALQKEILENTPGIMYDNPMPINTVKIGDKWYEVEKDNLGNETVIVNGERRELPQNAQRDVGTKNNRVSLFTPEGQTAWINRNTKALDILNRADSFFFDKQGNVVSDPLNALLDYKHPKDTQRRNEADKNIRPVYNEMITRGFSPLAAAMLIKKHYDPTTWPKFSSDKVRDTLFTDPDYNNPVGLSEYLSAKTLEKSIKNFSTNVVPQLNNYYQKVQDYIRDSQAKGASPEEFAKGAAGLLRERDKIFGTLLKTVGATSGLADSTLKNDLGNQIDRTKKTQAAASAKRDATASGVRTLGQTLGVLGTNLNYVPTDAEKQFLASSTGQRALELIKLAQDDKTPEKDRLKNLETILKLPHGGNPIDRVERIKRATSKERAIINAALQGSGIPSESLEGTSQNIIDNLIRLVRNDTAPVVPEGLKP